MRQHARTDNQVSRKTAFVSGANACLVRNTPLIMGLDSGRLGVAIGLVSGEEAMSLTERP